MTITMTPVYPVITSLLSQSWGVALWFALVVGFASAWALFPVRPGRAKRLLVRLLVPAKAPRPYTYDYRTAIPRGTAVPR